MSYKKVSITLACTFAAIICVVLVALSATLRPAYQENMSSDYSVEHVSDRIAAKIGFSASITPPHY